jgi:serine/threonine protein kinase
MALTIGTQLGSHEITALLGKGGMGEVYRARDTKLKRDVAIKILPDEFSLDPARVTRFQREAEVLAALNHPNIAAIYDLQEADGVRFLVLELIEGETLAERITRGPIPVEESLAIAKQMAEGLEAAHEKGVTHRDFKPANIKTTPRGMVKVLDFGLAKVLASNSAGVAFSEMPTVTFATGEGILVGTAAYMSPEQARGQMIDKRSDIWSFGCVLFEMLTGRGAFAGATVPDTIAAVIEREPEWDSLPAALPSNIRRLILRCLHKDPRRRLHDIADAALEIDDALGTPPAPPPVAFIDPSKTRRERLSGFAIGALVALLLGTTTFLLQRRLAFEPFGSRADRQSNSVRLFPQTANG